MRLKNAIDQKLFDIRLRDKFLADTKITKDELNDYLKSLPDDAKNSEYIDSRGVRHRHPENND